MNISLSCGNWKQMHHPRLAKHIGVIFFLNWHFSAKNLNSFDALLLDFSVLKFLSNQRNWYTKNLSNYVKLQFWMIKFTVVQKFCTWHFGQNGVLVNCIVQKMRFCKIAQLFLVSVSLVRGKSGRKFKTEQSSLIQSFQTYVNIKSCQIVEVWKL